VLRQNGRLGIPLPHEPHHSILLDRTHGERLEPLPVLERRD
jgi:hypothetical protein